MGVQLPPDPQSNSEPQTQCIIYCTGENQAMQICVNEFCKNNRPFTCGTRKCICQQQHKLCSKASIDYIIQFIKTKVASASILGKDLSYVLSCLIQKLSEIKHTLDKQIQLSLKYSSLSSIQLQLLKTVQKNQSTDSLSGQLLSKMWKQINLNSQQLIQIKQNTKAESSLTKLQQKVTLLQKSINQNIQQFIFAFNQITKSKKQHAIYLPSVQRLNLDLQKPISKHQYQDQPQSIFLALSKSRDQLNINSELKNYSLKEITNQMLTQSTVITKTSQASDLIAFFSQKQLTNLRLLFKASQHNFSISKYNQICTDQTDTLILCKTKKNRVIGGYTPLSFKSKSWFPSMQADLTQQTFLFTLTHNQKFPIRDWHNAIIGGASTLKFGLDEFVIIDKADTNVQCKFALSNSFKCPNYKPQDSESNLLLNGNSTCFFSVREWEVWKVQFAQK